MSSRNGLQNSVHQLAWYVAKAFNVARQTCLRAKYRSHAFDRRFDWAWEKTNYNRISLVNLLIAKKHKPAYLEIGCASNDLFDSVPCSSKVGVDPAAGGTVRVTSDEFFQTNSQFFDVVFIDGLHTYDQVRRDVVNSIRFLKAGGYVALHDMLPASWLEHHVPRINNAWTGDVWKVAFEISLSQGLDFKIVKIDHGVGVFKICSEKPDLVDLSGELKKQEFEYYYKNLDKLPLIEWDEFVRWLG